MLELTETNFQSLISTQEKWDELLTREGLQIVDVCEQWCMNCRPISKLFWKLHMKHQNKLLKFAIAVCNNIESLERYRGRSEPTFLLFGAGVLIDTVRTANGPIIDKTITKRLQEEILASKGLFERKEIKDPFLVELDKQHIEEEMSKDYYSFNEELALVIITSSVSDAVKITEIKAKFIENDILIVSEERRQVTHEEATLLYTDNEDAEFYDKLLSHITLDKAYLFLLRSQHSSVLHKLHPIIGPISFINAKSGAPESLRAIYGKSNLENAIHFAEDIDQTEKEIKIFYPTFEFIQVKIHKTGKTMSERTLAIIRPTAKKIFKDSIIENIKSAGFSIIYMKEMSFSREDCDLFYQHQIKDEYYEDLIIEMTDGKLLAFCIQRRDAINKWRQMLGSKDMEYARKFQPNSMRAKYSQDDIYVNLLHGSSSYKDAEFEIKYFFPVEQIVLGIKPDAFDSRDEILELIVENGFFIAISKEIVLVPNDVYVIYSEHNRKVYFSKLVEHMTSGKCLFVVLSKQNAFNEINSIVGETDPEIAGENSPDSLRGLYGRDIIQNAIYKTTNKKETERIIQHIFGDIEFDKNGKLLKDGSSENTEGYADDFVDDVIEEAMTVIGDNTKFEYNDKEIEKFAEDFVDDIIEEANNETNEKTITRTRSTFSMKE